MTQVDPPHPPIQATTPWKGVNFKQVIEEAQIRADLPSEWADYLIELRHDNLLSDQELMEKYHLTAEEMQAYSSSPSPTTSAPVPPSIQPGEEDEHPFGEDL